MCRRGTPDVWPPLSGNGKGRSRLGRHLPVLAGWPLAPTHPVSPMWPHFQAPQAYTRPTGPTCRRTSPKPPLPVHMGRQPIAALPGQCSPHINLSSQRLFFRDFFYTQTPLPRVNGQPPLVKGDASISTASVSFLFRTERWRQ